ncbi:18372_t:CDS:2, partial [Funneliformis geosporum]
MNLFDSCTIIFDRLRANYPTFCSHNAVSRIDYVWSSVDIASHLVKCSTVDVPSNLSDHSIVILKCENFLNIKQTKRKIPLKKVFNLDKMTTDILIAAHSEGLLFAINDFNLLGISMKHRLKQLQQREWLANCPLVCWPYSIPSKDSDWVVNVLCEWNKSTITVQIPVTAHNLIKGGNTPLHN